MFDYSKTRYQEQIKFYLEQFQEDRLLTYIEKEGWLNEFFSDETFFGSIDLQMNYTNNQAAKLLGLSRGQRIINLLNNREVDLNTEYLNPYKIGDRYAHDPIIMFKFKLIFFLFNKGLNTLEIGNILGLAAPTAAGHNFNQRQRSTVQDAINRTQIREVVFEQFAPFYDILNNFTEYHERSLEHLQSTYTEQLEYSEKMNSLLNHLNNANNDITTLERRIADLTINATTLTNSLENFEQIKRLNLKTDLMAKVSKQQKSQPVVKQGLIQRLFGKQEEASVTEHPNIDAQLHEIDSKNIKGLFNEEETEVYEQILSSIKNNTEEMNKALEFLGSARERKKHIETEIEKLRNTKTTPGKITDLIENPLKLNLEKIKHSLDVHSIKEIDNENKIEEYSEDDGEPSPESSFNTKIIESDATDVIDIKK